MSWKIINEILALASLDPIFRDALQRDPVAAAEAQGFELTDEEKRVFREYASIPLAEFCQGLLEQLGSPPLEES